MPEGLDPLGKRALFWMPVGVEAEGDAGLDAPGIVADSNTPHDPRHARPTGRRALFSDATPTGEPDRARETATAEDPFPSHGLLTLACSRCGSVTRVGLVTFLLLQFPVGAWLPGRSFDHWMTCPTCRHRTWVSASFTR